jgi:hypothetical protein
MRVYVVPAAYRRYLESTIAAELRRIELDQQLRADEEPRIRKLATVPDQFIDAGAEGVTLVAVLENAEDEASVHADLERARGRSRRRVA